MATKYRLIIKINYVKVRKNFLIKNHNAIIYYQIMNKTIQFKLNSLLKANGINKLKILSV